MEDKTFEKVLGGGYYSSSEAPAAPSSGQSPATQPQAQGVQAINASMKLQGATSLPPNKAAELKRVLYEIGEAVISMSEVVHNESGISDTDKYERIFANEKVIGSVAQVMSLAIEDASRVEQDPDLHATSQATQEELVTLVGRLGATFEDHRSGALTSVQAATHLCALLLTVMERCTTLLGLVDKHTVKCIAAIGAQCKATFHDMHKFFVESGIPTNTADFDGYVASVFNASVENACNTFTRRSVALAAAPLKARMAGDIDLLRTAAAQFVQAVRAHDSEEASKCKARAWGAVDDACDVAREVPAFCVVMNIDKISGEFDIKCARFLNGVRKKDVPEIGAAGREITGDVNEGVRYARSLGCLESACSEALAAAAESFTLAKAAIKDPTEYPKVVTAVERLKTAYACLPKQTVSIHSDSVIKKTYTYAHT